MATKTKETETLPAFEVEGTETAEDINVEIEKQIYYINEATKEHKTGPVEVLHWTEIDETTLYPRSTLLSHIPDDARYLNELYECRFYSKTNDLRAVEVVIDKNFVYNRLSEFLTTYSKTAAESKELVLQAQNSAAAIRERRMQNELAALAQRNGISVEELVAKFKV